MQILHLMTHLEIAVSGQIIGKEPEPQFKRNKTNRMKNQLPVMARKEISCPRKVACKNLPAQLYIKDNLGEISRRLP